MIWLVFVAILVIIALFNVFTDKEEKLGGNESDIQAMMNSGFYKKLVDNYKQRNRGIYDSNIYLFKPNEPKELRRVVIDRIYIKSGSISSMSPSHSPGESQSHWWIFDIEGNGYKDLSDYQIDLLARTLVSSGMFTYVYKDKDSFGSKYICLQASCNYWKPILQKKYDNYCSQQKSQYEKTHKDIL